MHHLNVLQKQAVRNLSSNTLVEAGPGTGKTRVLTARIAWLIEQGTPPGSILAITFTNKAAGEMAGRIRAEVLSSRIRITTFHSWAFHFLRERLPENSSLTVISEAEQKRIFRLSAQSLGLSGKTGDLFERLQFAKQFYPVRPGNDTGEPHPAWKAYQDYLRGHGLYDYDDLILSAIALLERAEEDGSAFGQYGHLLIDEFQDVSPAQYRLLRLLAGKGCRVMAIGDPHQSIYGFRGSDPGLMKQFQKDFTPCTRINLATAYRCPQKILDAARRVLKDTTCTGLESARSHRGKIILKRFRDQHREAAWIAKKIDGLCGGISFESFNRGIATGDSFRSLSDMAVLYRINRLGENIAAELEKAGIPFQLSRSSGPLSEQKLNRLWHLLEILEGRAEDYHLSSLVHRDRERLAALPDYRRNELKTAEPSTFLDAISKIFEFGFVPAEKSLFERAVAFHRQGRPLSLALKAEQDCLDFKVEAVSLLSLHASKGLEFPVVFIAGCDQDILPWEKGEISEERRLFYVGLTRASHQVFITCAAKRTFWGRRLETGCSEFSEEIRPFISEELAPLKKRKKRHRQKKLF